MNQARGPNAEIFVTQVTIDWSLVEQLTTEYLWFDSPGDMWRRLVFNSRRQLRLPEELRYLGEKDILIGHIASGKNVKYERLSSYEEIHEGDLLTVDVEGRPTKAIQWVFQTDDAQEAFQERCKGTVWLHSVGAFSHSYVAE